MTLEMLKSKIHRATVTQAELNYVGSITIDESLMEAAGIIEYEKVQIADVDNGARFETYVIAGETGSGIRALLQDELLLTGYGPRTVDLPDDCREVRRKPPDRPFLYGRLSDGADSSPDICLSKKRLQPIPNPKE